VVAAAEAAQGVAGVGAAGVAEGPLPCGRGSCGRGSDGRGSDGRGFILLILFQDEPFPPFCKFGKFQDLTEFLEAPGCPIDPQRDYWDTAVESFKWKGRQRHHGGAARDSVLRRPTVAGARHPLDGHERLSGARMLAAGARHPYNGRPYHPSLS